MSHNCLDRVDTIQAIIKHSKTRGVGIYSQNKKYTSILGETILNLRAAAGDSTLH